MSGREREGGERGEGEERMIKFDSQLSKDTAEMQTVEMTDLVLVEAAVVEDGRGQVGVAVEPPPAGVGQSGMWRALL